MRLHEILERTGSIEKSAARVFEAAVRAPARSSGLSYRQDVSGLFRDGVRIEWLAGRHGDVLSQWGAPRLAAVMAPYLLGRVGDESPADAHRDAPSPAQHSPGEASSG